MCGELFSSNFEVDLNDDPGSFGGAATTRKCTDILGLIIMVLIFGATIGLTMHCINNSEVEKLINGYDECGNICGKNNIKTDSIPYDCFGKNHEDKAYLYIKDDDFLPIIKTNKLCFSFCLTKIGHYCALDKSLAPFYIKLLKLHWWAIPMVCAVSLLFGICIYYLIFCADKAETRMQYRPEVMIVCFIIMAGTLPIIGYMWLRTSGTNEYLIIASILAASAAVVFILIIPSLYANHKKIDIVYQFNQEIAEATNSIKLICIFPILFSIIIGACVFGLIYCSIYLESFSYPEKIDELSSDEPIIGYIQYPIATMTQVLLIYTIFLFYEFMKNLQTLIISGWVAQRYFTKKDDEDSKSSTTPLLKHVGSVCCASLILSATFPIRVVVNAVKGIVILSYKKCLYSCSRPLTTETLFLTRNGLIMTAIHGSSFCAGTVRARKLLYHNVFNAAGICTFEDFVLLCTKLLLWILPNVFCYLFSCTTTYNSFKREVVYLVCCGILAALLFDYYASAIEIVINTMFLCFCEDCAYNNGTSKPYFMSAKFAQFVEDANKFVDEDKWNTVADKWSGGPGRLY